jgi:hypothetical protein
MRTNISVRGFSPICLLISRTDPQLVKLNDSEMAAIGNAHKKPGLHTSLLGQYFDEDGKIMGWSTEQMGWETDGKRGGIVPDTYAYTKA